MIEVIPPKWARVVARGLEFDAVTWPVRAPDGVFITGSTIMHEALAAQLGARLPTPEELLAIFVAAAWATDPIPLECGKSTAADHTHVVTAKLADAGITDDHLIANIGKPWCASTGGPSDPALLGECWWVWQPHDATAALVDHWSGDSWRGIPTYSSALGRTEQTSGEWRVLQPRSTFHRRDDRACGYESVGVYVRGV